VLLEFLVVPQADKNNTAEATAVTKMRCFMSDLLSYNTISIHETSAKVKKKGTKRVPFLLCQNDTD
jgi:hypothetical protein